MGQLRGLIDTNVLIALAASDHIHHEPSMAMSVSLPPAALAVAVHSLSEFFNIATRQFPRGLGLSPLAARKVLSSYADEFSVVGLTQTEQIAAILEFALKDRSGPVIYDFLIGQVAVNQEISTIITWNTKHMTPLFPGLTVINPTQFLKEH